MITHLFSSTPFTPLKFTSLALDSCRLRVSMPPLNSTNKAVREAVSYHSLSLPFGLSTLDKTGEAVRGIDTGMLLCSLVLFTLTAVSMSLNLYSCIDLQF